MDYGDEKKGSTSAEGPLLQEDSKHSHLKCYQETSGCINLKK
jgi:hypothetical protein